MRRAHRCCLVYHRPKSLPVLLAGLGREAVPLLLHANHNVTARGDQFAQQGEAVPFSIDDVEHGRDAHDDTVVAFLGDAEPPSRQSREALPHEIATLHHGLREHGRAPPFVSVGKGEVPVVGPQFSGHCPGWPSTPRPCPGGQRLASVPKPALGVSHRTTPVYAALLRSAGGPEPPSFHPTFAMSPRLGRRSACSSSCAAGSRR